MVRNVIMIELKISTLNSMIKAEREKCKNAILGNV